MMLELKSIACAAVLALTAAGATAANAGIYDFTYSGAGYSGSGTFTTGGTGSPYTVTGITGTANGSPITGLSGYAGADQLLYIPGPAFADFNGISFTNSTGVAFNLAYSSGMVITDSGVNPNGLSNNITPISLSVAAVPEPATWAMFILGAATIGLAARRRREGTALAA